MHEGHKPSVSREGERSHCHVLLPRAVCLQEGATWLCTCVCVLRAMGLDREIGPPSSLMTIECVSQDDSLLRAPGWHSTGPHAGSSRCRKPKRTAYLSMRVYVQLSLNSHESTGHVSCSLIVMLKSLQKKRWKIPNLGGHALRPPDLFVCSCNAEKGNSLCL